jgi:hypothetical protein
MSWRHCVAVALGLGGCVGCAGAPPSAEAPAAPSASALPAASVAPSAPSASSAVPAASVAPAASSAPAVASGAAPARPAEPIGPICQAKCDKLVSKCGKASVESCRLNCGKYEPPPAGCAEQVRAALACARDAHDLTCANVAPESCAAKFRDIAACSAGEAPTPKAPAPAGLPEGWETVSDAADGFSLAMPRGSSEKAGPEGPVRSVTAPDGTLYTVSVLPLLNDKPSEKSLLHFLMKVQGRCSDKVKLDGFVEKEGRSSIHYTAHCPDKTDWNGMIYIGKRNLILLSAQAAAGKVGLTEPFFYEFEFSEH